MQRVRANKIVTIENKERKEKERRKTLGRQQEANMLIDKEKL